MLAAAPAVEARGEGVAEAEDAEGFGHGCWGVYSAGAAGMSDRCMHSVGVVGKLAVLGVSRLYPRRARGWFGGQAGLIA